MKKVLALMLVLVLALSMAACGSTASSTASTAGSGATTEGAANVKIGFTAMNLTDPFQITVEETLQALAIDKGWEFMSGDGNGDNEKQVELINDMITAGITHLVLCPVSADGILPALAACKEAGVTVINYDSMVTDTDYIAAYVASDNFIAGQQAGQWLLDNYPDGGELTIIDNPKAESVVQRVAGLKDALEGSKFEIVDDFAISTLEEVLSKTEDSLTANPDLKFIFGLNDSCGLIAVGAAQSANRDIVVVSVDGSPDGKASIKDGGLKATAGQSPIAIGEGIYDIIDKLTSGEELTETNISIPTILIDANNVDEYGVDGWQ